MKITSSHYQKWTHTNKSNQIRRMVTDQVQIYILWQQLDIGSPAIQVMLKFDFVPDNIRNAPQYSTINVYIHFKKTWSQWIESIMPARRKVIKKMIHAAPQAARGRLFKIYSSYSTENIRNEAHLKQMKFQEAINIKQRANTKVEIIMFTTWL